MSGWIGVDLDGTLAEYHGWAGLSIGAPVPAMVAKVRAAMAAGIEVRVFTARVSSAKGEEERGRQRAGIEAWCLAHVGAILAVTSEKDHQMIECWDDRAREVVPNTGEFRR